MAEPFNAEKLPGVSFYSASFNRKMRYIYPDTEHWCAGWILSQGTDGGWRTERKATQADIAAINGAVAGAHHEEAPRA